MAWEITTMHLLRSLTRSRCLFLLAVTEALASTNNILYIQNV